MGGNMDGMGDLNNAPMPPMGSDMGMQDPMGGQEDPMAGGMPQDPMGDQSDPMQDPMGGDDQELNDVINSLSMEDKAAVLKYAKSMADESNGGGMPQDPMGGGMPTESVKSFRKIIDETINDVLDSKEGTDRPQRKLPKSYRGIDNPFKAP